jgi:hypothetical protein
MNRQQRFCTAVQEIALNLIFTVLGERRVNRTREEYAAIVARLPPLKVLTFEVNETLRWMHKRSACSGVSLPQICRFRAGDERYAYEEYPSQISYETVRAALDASGMRLPRGRRAKPF